MARVPVVETPCPIAGKRLPAGATEHCTLCERTVHNLDRMNERERVAFMSVALRAMALSRSCAPVISVTKAWRVVTSKAPTVPRRKRTDGAGLDDEKS